MGRQLHEGTTFPGDNFEESQGIGPSPRRSPTRPRTLARLCWGFRLGKRTFIYLLSKTDVSSTRVVCGVNSFLSRVASPQQPVLLQLQLQLPARRSTAALSAWAAREPRFGQTRPTDPVLQQTANQHRERDAPSSNRSGSQLEKAELMPIKGQIIGKAITTWSYLEKPFLFCHIVNHFHNVWPSLAFVTQSAQL